MSILASVPALFLALFSTAHAAPCGGKGSIDEMAADCQRVNPWYAKRCASWYGKLVDCDDSLTRFRWRLVAEIPYGKHTARQIWSDETPNRHGRRTLWGDSTIRTYSRDVAMEVCAKYFRQAQVTFRLASSDDFREAKRRGAGEVLPNFQRVFLTADLPSRPRGPGFSEQIHTGFSGFKLEFEEMEGSFASVRCAAEY